ncbi:MAG: response regulator [Anaerolineales bacterium]|nr:response regulator [Anaerolineales bacterium]
MVKLVVIEDEFDIRDAVIDWLQFEGYEVYGAKNGKLGLQMIYDINPDMVLCDISMPEMDGHTVLVELRSDPAYEQLPFVFLTAAADREAMRQGMNLGADDYITKPFNQAEVLRAVKTRLNKQEQIKSQIEQLGNLIEEERELRLLKSRLVGMFSHDFRNSLTIILSASKVLQSYSDRLSPERRRERFRRIDGSVHLLLQMLDEMLMVAEIENGQLSHHAQATNLKKLIEKVVRDFNLIDGNRHQITASINLPEVVLIDEKLVQHIITNLVSNALKYSPPDSEVCIQSFVEEGQVIITVQDAGIGIPEEDISKVFEPFFRANNAQSFTGSGLGLALVNQVVNVCQGTIKVSSKVGEGSLFTVKIPLPLAQ